MNLFPAPKSLRLNPGAPTTIPPDAFCALDLDLNDRLLFHLGRFLDICQSTSGIRPRLAPGHTGAKAWLKIQLRPKGLGGQEYTLVTGKGRATLHVGSETAIHYGLLTLGQIIAERQGKLPDLAIKDAPDFQRRGFMLDVSRCKVPKVTEICTLIEKISQLKLNELQLYTEHTFAFAKHPVVWREASPYTAEDMLVIRAHCRKNYIDLVPNLNSFGHFERWLRHKEYHRFAICPRGFTSPYGVKYNHGSTLMPDKASLDFISSLYEEYLPLFDSPCFNVGGDETYELGQGRSRELCERRGKLAVYRKFLEGICSTVKGHGRQMMFWSDIILKDPAQLEGWPDGTIAMIWGYEQDHPFAKECGIFKHAGIPFYVVPGTSSWNTLAGRLDNALGNLASAARCGRDNGATGYLITDWGDGGHHQSPGISHPGILAGACHSWCVDTNSNPHLREGLARFFHSGNSDLSDILLEMGNLYLMTGKLLKNSTLFHHLLFNPGKQGLLDGLAPSALAKCLRSTQALLNRLEKVVVINPDLALLKDEWRLALQLCLLALDRGNRLLKGKPAGVPARQLQPLISEYDRLWLIRNRPGGLKESRGKLESLRQNKK